TGGIAGSGAYTESCIHQQDGGSSGEHVAELGFHETIISLPHDEATAWFLAPRARFLAVDILLRSEVFLEPLVGGAHGHRYSCRHDRFYPAHGSCLCGGCFSGRHRKESATSLQWESARPFSGGVEGR